MRHPVVTGAIFKGVAHGGPRAGETIIHCEKTMNLYGPGTRGLPRIDSPPQILTIVPILVGTYYFSDGLWIWERVT